jgi:release factor glutamine methyltransferase
MSLPVTVRQALEQAKAASNPDTASLRTLEALLAHVLGRDRAWLYAHDHDALSEGDINRFGSLAARLSQGEPLAYLTGYKEFCGLLFEVTPDVLIPRPETELLVDVVLKWAESKAASPMRIADIGTGSGAIAVTLAVRLPDAQVWAVDRSEKALATAYENAERHGVLDRITWAEGDLLQPLSGPFEVIVANLPYIPSADLAVLEVSRWEPALALDGGANGLGLIRRLISEAVPKLSSHGLLTLEIQFDQSKRVSALITQTIPGARVEIHHDLAGLDRVVSAIVP